jgi:hypothetical protein
MSSAQCTGTNKRGERCQARAIERGLCAVHSGRVNPAEIGRKGGSRSPQTKLRKAADDQLRELARKTLEKSLRGEEVAPQALAAAKSLFSYRADAPPAGEQARGQQGPAKVVGLIDVSLIACECRLYSADGVDPAAEASFLEALRARKPASDVDGAAHIAHPLPSQESTNEDAFGVPAS